MQTFLYVVLAIVILLLMVVIHEFGHYVAGKILKFKINEFSVGFGPKIFSKKKKNGEVFSLRLIPLGGFCAFEGEEAEETAQVAGDALFNDEKVNQTADVGFLAEKPWKRIIVLISGGLFNVVSAVIFSLIFLTCVGYSVPKVNSVYLDTSGNPYCQLIDGDEILTVNGKKVGIMHNFNELTAKLKLGDDAQLKVRRDGKTITVNLQVKSITATDGTVYNGFGFVSTSTYKKANFLSALAYCVPFTAKTAWSILESLWQLLTGRIPITSITGPVGTIEFMASASQANWRNILLLLPVIAANLGLFNLLPIPALDGSKVVFTIIEWIRKKPINRKIENTIHAVGLIALFAFVIIVDVIGMILR